MKNIPKPLLIDILRRVGQYGFRNLASFIVVGPDFKDIVFADEVLHEVDIQEYIFNISYANEDSGYRSFLAKCLEAKNHTAQYVEGLRLAAQIGPSELAINTLGEAAPHLLCARFALGVFLICCGSFDQGMLVVNSFLQKVTDFQEAVQIGDMVASQITRMGTPGSHAYVNHLWFGCPPYCRLDHCTSLDICPHCFAFTYATRFAEMC